MNGMEKMIASMMGITPEKMQEIVQGAVNLLQSLDGRLSNIERQLDILVKRDAPVTLIEDKSDEREAV